LSSFRYLNFAKPIIAADSDLTDDEVIVRNDGNDVIGYMIIHASRRSQKLKGLYRRFVGILGTPSNEFDG
jgi:hypothetical protein